MARVVLIGGDSALLEGLAQSLAAAGHLTSVSATAAAAREGFRTDPPLVVLADRRMGAELTRSKLAPGGALLLFHVADDAEPTPLPLAAQRAALADLTLPLERHRLLALVASVDARAASTGRTPGPTPPVHRAR